ncbi:MAG TPA: ABC transporter permease subunit [Anaerolineales bacterium]|nr:ABC transporter permease subunit [Anaerolineales bacterium]
MSTLGRILQTALNPRSRLDSVPGIAETAGDSPDLDSSVRPRSRLRTRDILLNFPLMFGGAILLGLFLVVLFGPLWAPTNPFISGQIITSHYDSVKGEWISPPLPPSQEYPLGTNEWGQDIASMLMFGARTTLVACIFIAMTRLILGLGLGAYAGWNEGGLVDNLTMGSIALITSVPMLISSMIIIYVLDIRRGLPVFIIALSIIGWTEIAQYIRGEFLVLRRMPFIEGARAVGASSVAIAVRHVLPNLMPQLLVITFLEIGAVLLLLGELSFVGVFIGGGSHIPLGDEITGIQVSGLSDVPEWGAMLADGYRWLRAQPFIVFPPAIAFFIAVVGFNSFGEGLRRLVEKSYLNTNFLLRKRMVFVIAALSLATVFIINNTGPAPWISRLARAFDGRSAYTHTQALSEIADRAPGRPGGDLAAAYIAEQFETYGLRPGWRQSSYIRPMETRLVRPLSTPSLTVAGPGGEPAQEFRHQIDFGYVIAGHGGSGEAAAPVTFVGFTGEGEELAWEDYQGLDLSGRILLLVEGNAPEDFPTEALLRGAEGVVWITDGETLDLPSQHQLADPEGRYLIRPTLPIFRIKPSAAEGVLAQAGSSLDGLFSGEGRAQAGRGWFARDLDLTVEMSLELDEPRTVEIPSALGFIPGSDFELSNEILVLFAAYDGLGLETDGTDFPSANQSAASVGVLLEAARLWQEQELNPRRSILFLAWGGGRLDDPGLREYLQNARSFSHLPGQGTTDPLAPVAIFQIQQAGAGGETVVVPNISDPQLKAVVEETASELGIALLPTGEIGDADLEQIARTPGLPWISLGWAGGEAPPDQDTLGRIDAKKLESFGELLSHALTRIVREASY